MIFISRSFYMLKFAFSEHFKDFSSMLANKFRFKFPINISIICLNNKLETKSQGVISLIVLGQEELKVFFFLPLIWKFWGILCIIFTTSFNLHSYTAGKCLWLPHRHHFTRGVKVITLFLPWAEHVGVVGLYACLLSDADGECSWQADNIWM